MENGSQIALRRPQDRATQRAGNRPMSRAGPPHCFGANRSDPRKTAGGRCSSHSWCYSPKAAETRGFGSRLNKVLLLRLDPEGFDPETKEHAADGVVAYSAVCVHTGCIPVATSPNGTPISSCSCAHAITPPLLQRKEPRWSAVQPRAACRHCH